jgi:hypothetical protein
LFGIIQYGFIFAAQQMQQGVDDQTAIHWRPTSFLGKRQQRFDLLPLRFGQISRVTLGSLHPKPKPHPCSTGRSESALSNTPLAGIPTSVEILNFDVAFWPVKAQHLLNFTLDLCST